MAVPLVVGACAGGYKLFREKKHQQQQSEPTNNNNNNRQGQPRALYCVVGGAVLSLVAFSSLVFSPTPVPFVAVCIVADRWYHVDSRTLPSVREVLQSAHSHELPRPLH